MEDQFDPWLTQDRYDLLFLEFIWICLRLEWKITSTTLIYFNWFRTHGKWGCGNMISPGAAEFCLGLWWISSPCMFVMRIYKVLAFNRLFGLQQAIWKFWWDLLITAEQMREFHHHWFGDTNVSQRFHRDSSWNNTCIGAWTLCFVGMRSDDLRHRYFREPEARVFRPLLFEKLYNVFCGVYLRWWCRSHRFWMLEQQVMRIWNFSDAMRSFVFARKFIWAWVLFCAWNKSKTNNLYKQFFDVFCGDNSLV